MIALLCCLAFDPASFVDSQSSVNDGIVWRHDLRAAEKESEASKKPLFLVVTFPTCKWWIRMERTTMKDPQVIDLVRSTIPVVVNVELNEELGKRLKVSECPLILLYSTEGKTLLRIHGFQETKRILQQMKGALGL